MAHTRTRNIKTLDIIRANNMIPSFNKFSSLNKGNAFTRWDLIPRYLAIENHFNENDYGWELFRKLRMHQSAEFGDGHSQKMYDQSAREDFETLIDNMKASGYNKKYPLVINEESMRITKGWLRFSCCLYFQLNTIPCKYDVIDSKSEYDLNWMTTEVGYSAKEINLIVGGRDRLFEKLEKNILSAPVDKSDE